jgi:cell division septum initiation protein DivIVA
MEREGDLGNYLRFNFENAIEMIDRLTKDNNSLLDRVEELETKLNTPSAITTKPIHSRFAKASKEADAAMKRFTDKLRKGANKNGKSKQSEGQPV